MNKTPKTKPKPPDISEAELVKTVLQAFKDDDTLFLWRSNTGATKHTDQYGKPRFVRFNEPGTPDILGVAKRTTCPKCHRCTGVGVLVGIECKSNTGKATDAQLRWIDRATNFGAIAFVLRPETDERFLRIRQRILEKINDVCADCANRES